MVDTVHQLDPAVALEIGEGDVQRLVVVRRRIGIYDAHVGMVLVGRPVDGGRIPDERFGHRIGERTDVGIDRVEERGGRLGGIVQSKAVVGRERIAASRRSVHLDADRLRTRRDGTDDPKLLAAVDVVLTSLLYAVALDDRSAGNLDL